MIFLGRLTTHSPSITKLKGHLSFFAFRSLHSKFIIQNHELPFILRHLKRPRPPSILSNQTQMPLEQEPSKQNNTVETPINVLAMRLGESLVRIQLERAVIWHVIC